MTQAALKLQMIGAIQYSRGHIAVLDREELENTVCECYSVVNDEYERLLWNPTHCSDTVLPVTQQAKAQAKNCGR